MKNIFIILIAVLFISLSQEALSHCRSNNNNTYQSKPRSGTSACGCYYFWRRTFVGWDCNRKPIYKYVKIVSHTRCRNKRYRSYRYHSYRSHRHCQ